MKKPKSRKSRNADHLKQCSEDASFSCGSGGSGRKEGDISTCTMSSYINPTVFVRNAANLTQLLPKS
jgi:hypothetical protein